MTTALHCHDVLPLAYKFSKRLSSTASLHQLIHHHLSITTSIAHFSEFPAENLDPKQTMVSAKRLAQLAKKWQRMAAVGRKRLTLTVKEDEECCTSVAIKGHCVVYTTEGRRFEVPLVYLSTKLFGELLRMSQEEFGFASDGKITLPCDAAVIEYAMCFLRRNASAKVENALLSSIVMSCHYTNCPIPAVGTSQKICWL